MILFCTTSRSSLSALKISLEEDIQQLEMGLRDRRTTPLTVHGGGESTVPQLFVPEITIPVSLSSTLEHINVSVIQHLGLELLPPSPVKTHPPKTPDGKMQRASELRLLTSDGKSLWSC